MEEIYRAVVPDPEGRRRVYEDRLQRERQLESVYADARVTITTEMIRATLMQIFREHGDFMRTLHQQNQQHIKDIADLLKKAHINRHHWDHQNRVAAIAIAVMKAFTKGSEDPVLNASTMRSVAYGATGHDLGYQLPAGKRAEDMKGKKEEMDNHPKNGADRFIDLRSYETFRKYFDGWEDDEILLAAETILYHSNGSDYSREDVHLAAQVVRFADKIDNIHLRVDTDVVVPSIREDDSKYQHRLVPASIQSMHIDIDKEKQVINVIHYVDTSVVAAKLSRGNPREEQSSLYDQDQFVADFQNAYAKSMSIASEVALSLFEHDNGETLPRERAWLRATFKFGRKDADGFECNGTESMLTFYPPGAQPGLRAE